MVKKAFYWYVPGGSKAGFLAGCYWNFCKFRRVMPLLTLTAPYWWKSVIRDYQEGFQTCGCGRTWWKYRLLPALIGDKRFGGGC